MNFGFSLHTGCIVSKIFPHQDDHDDGGGDSNDDGGGGDDGYHNHDNGEEDGSDGELDDQQNTKHGVNPIKSPTSYIYDLLCLRSVWPYPVRAEAFGLHRDGSFACISTML